MFHETLNEHINLSRFKLIVLAQKSEFEVSKKSCSGFTWLFTFHHGLDREFSRQKSLTSIGGKSFCTKFNLLSGGVQQIIEN